MNTSLGYSKRTLTDSDVLLSGGGHKPVADFSLKTESIPYIKGPSTDTTAGTWTGSYSGITAYTEGLTILYVPAVAGASTTKLNINNLGAKTCYISGSNTKLTTHYPVGTPIIFTYYNNGWRIAEYYVSDTRYYLTLNGKVLGHSGKTNLGTFYAVATSDATAKDQVWMRNADNSAYTWRTLGSNAFTSTSYLPLAGGTMNLGEGLKFHSDNNYFGTDCDARIISLLDGNDTICDGGLIIDERATLSGVEHVTELLRIRDNEFKWKGNAIWHAGNDGTGSGLDADLLDGIDGADYLSRHNVDNDYDTTSGQKIITVTAGSTIVSEAQYGSLIQWGNSNKTPETADDSTWYNQLIGMTNDRLYFRTRTNGGDWTTAKKIAFITDIPINFKAYTGSLASSGWKTLQGRDSSPSIAIADNDGAAFWNSSTYSASLVFGCSDTRGLLDCAYNTPKVTFGGCSYSNSTDDNPNWYMKLSGTNGTTYNLDSMPYATSAGNADTLDGYHYNNLPYVERLNWWNEGDSHNANDLLSGTTFVYANHNAPTTGTMVAFNCSNNTGYPLQLQGQYGGENLFFRNRNGDNGTWQNWRYVIHSGNIGSQSVNYANSAGNADTVDGHHAGVLNGQASIFVYWPSSATMISEGFLTSDYGTSGYGHPDEVYLQAICKWSISHYTDLGDVTLIGSIAPNSSGTVIMHLYSSSGKDSTTLLPRYCSSTYQNLSGSIYEFGCINYTWYYRRLSAGNAHTVDGYHASGLFTAFDNSGNNITATIGGTTKTFTVNYASTVPWTGVTGVMQAGNEFNIPDSGYEHASFWFNHLPRNSRTANATLITDYYFGNLGGGYANLRANGFIKNGSSDSYVLLGGGGHKALNNLQVTGTASALNALDVTKTFIYATVSSNQTLGVSAAMTVGQVLTVLVYNSGSSSITVTVPTSDSWKSLDGLSLTIGALKFGEISILCYTATVYMVSAKLQ